MKSLVLLLPALLVLPVAAQPVTGTAAAPIVIGQPAVMDNVQFELSAEDWVETTTAKVTVAIDAALNGADAGKVRAAMQKAVGDLAPDGQWRFTGFDRSTDQSGLETWHAALEARLKETALGGLADKAKSASKPGLQIKIDTIEFTPTLAETEALKAKLRNQIYGEINDELKRLAAAQPDRKFRIAQIAFEDEGSAPAPMPRPMVMRSNLATMATPGANMGMGGNAALPEPAAPPVAVGQKLTVKARVMLSAVAPRE
jgi:hypothetical protein